MIRSPLASRHKLTCSALPSHWLGAGTCFLTWSADPNGIRISRVSLKKHSLPNWTHCLQLPGSSPPLDTLATDSDALAGPHGAPLTSEPHADLIRPLAAPSSTQSNS